MADRVTLAVGPIVMKIDGQLVLVETGTVVDVANAGAFAPGQVTGVIVGGGTLTGGVHNRAVSNVRLR
jgi:hypothetical protein